MRFVLDEDVDNDLIGDLGDQGHDAWSIPQAGLGSVPDETVAVYGHEKGAAVITHDAEFSKWRKKRCVGQHIWLHCRDTRARETFMAHAHEIFDALAHHQDVWIEVTPETFDMTVEWE